MRMRRTFLALALVGSALFVTAPSAGAQYCEEDDYSTSCRAQRQCEETRDRLATTGLNIVNCTH